MQLLIASEVFLSTLSVLCHFHHASALDSQSSHVRMEELALMLKTQCRGFYWDCGTMSALLHLNSGMVKQTSRNAWKTTSIFHLTNK